MEEVNCIKKLWKWWK